jgi:hypothetical protein
MADPYDLEVRLINKSEELAQVQHSRDEEYLRLVASGKGSWDAQRMADVKYGIPIARLQTEVFLIKQRYKEAMKHAHQSAGTEVPHG